MSGVDLWGNLYQMEAGNMQKHDMVSFIKSYLQMGFT